MEQTGATLIDPKFLSLVGYDMTELTKDIIRAGLEGLAKKPEVVRDLDLANSVIIIVGDNSERVAVTFSTKSKLTETLREAGLEKNVQPNVIERCKQPTLPNVARLLFITPDMVGSCQVGASSHFLESDATLDSVKEKIVDALSPFSKPVQREVLQNVLQNYETADAILNDNPELSDEARRLLPSLLPEFQERWGDVEKRARVAPPPASAETALDIEALIMSAAYILTPLNDPTPDGARSEAIHAVLTYYCRRSPALFGLFTKLQVLYPRDRGSDASDKLIAIFGTDWLNSGFPKVEVGHKLAASFALTDVPNDIDVQAPWTAWSLIIPDGLLPEVVSVNDTMLKEPSSFARAWCVGTRVRYLVLANGSIIGPLSNRQENSSSHVLAVQALVQSVCLAISNPDDYKKRAVSSPSNASKKARRMGLPDFSCTRFLVSAPVQIDLREHLKDVVSGKAKTGGGGSPTVQFFVRGHWRNQVHGKGRLLRKQIRIEGFWKGDPNARVLLKNYKLKDEEATK